MKTQASVLFKTSTASDIQCSGGLLTAGNVSVRKSQVAEITQTKSKAEVAQVVTVGGAGDAPTASTHYTVKIGDENRRPGGVQEQLREFHFTTHATLTDHGSTAALQREAIYGDLVAQINAAKKLYVVAASLGSGNGFTVTDDAGYYPAFSHSGTGRKGASTVITVADPDSGLGFNDDYEVTTAAVYASGVGATLAAGTPVVDYSGGGLLSGYLYGAGGFNFKTTGGDPAVSGQNYDIFTITYLEQAPAHNQTGQLALVPRVAGVAVDNGTGSSTSNLAGFLAFERVMRKHIADTYASDKTAWIEFCDSPTFFQGAAGAVPTTTGENKAASDYGQWVYNLIGTATITVPTPGNTGILLDHDNADTEGAEHTPSLLTVNGQNFTVGKTDFTMVAKMLTADHTDATVVVGFRKKEAHAADFNNYNDLAGVGHLADDYYTWGILANATTVATNTTADATDAAYEEFKVKVDTAGLVTTQINGVTYPVYSVGTTPLVLDAGEVMIPTIRVVNISAGDPDVVLNHVMAVAGDWLK